MEMFQICTTFKILRSTRVSMRNIFCLVLVFFATSSQHCMENQFLSQAQDHVPECSNQPPILRSYALLLAGCLCTSWEMPIVTNSWTSKGTNLRRLCCRSHRAAVHGWSDNQITSFAKQAKSKTEISKR